MTRAFLLLGALCLPVFSDAFAQAGVPGARLETGRDHRAAVRAEAYISVSAFLTNWREAWQKRDANALNKLYIDDAVVRLPGHPVVRTRTPVEKMIHEAIASAAPIEMSDVDFHSDGEIAIVVSCYFTRQADREVKGLVTAVLLRSSRSWRVRAHMFDTPHPVGSGTERFSC